MCTDCFLPLGLTQGLGQAVATGSGRSIAGQPVTGNSKGDVGDCIERKRS